jgi:hypothetical protein
MSQSQTSGVIRSLENVRDRVKQRLTKVPAYRAFLAIETPMAEVADIPDLLAHLEAAKQKILEHLMLSCEYQALLTVEKAIKDISGVLEIVGDDASFDAAPAAVATLAPLAKTPTVGPTATTGHETPVVGLAALVHESFLAQLGAETRAAGEAEAEEAKVA